MAGVHTDLYAADVRYHVDCKATFLPTKSIQAVILQSSSSELKDAAFDSVIKYLAKNKASIHNSIHIYGHIWRKEDVCFPSTYMPIYGGRRMYAFHPHICPYMEEGGCMLSIHIYMPIYGGRRMYAFHPHICPYMEEGGCMLSIHIYAHIWRKEDVCFLGDS